MRVNFTEVERKDHTEMMTIFQRMGLRINRILTNNDGVAGRCVENQRPTIGACNASGGQQLGPLKDYFDLLK